MRENLQTIRVRSVQYPITTVVLILAGIIQAIFAAMGSPLNFLSALMWVTVLFIVVAELIWYKRKWSASRRIRYCGSIFLLLALVTFSPLKRLYNYSGENLRVSFNIQLLPQNKIVVAYTFRNSGKDSALVRNVGLFEIVAKNKESDEQKNIELCSADFQKTLMVLQVGVFMGPGVQVGGDEQKASIYWPTESKVENSLLNFSEPLPIAPGNVKVITSTFVFNPGHIGNFNVIAFCPLITTVDDYNRAQTSICKGTARTMGKDHFSSISTNEQFKLLPRSYGTICAQSQE